MTTDNPGPHNRRSARPSRHSKKKRSFFYNLYKWAKKNPTKVIAIIFGIILIYITILFIQYANRQEGGGKTTMLKMYGKK